MTAIPIFGGPSKRSLIQRAYAKCGIKGEFELDPDDYEKAQGLLDDMMAELAIMHGVNLNYNFPVTGVSDNATEESGIPIEAKASVVSLLAERLAPTEGASLKGGKSQSGALSLLISQYQVQPTMCLGRGTPIGDGNRGYYYPGRAFFPVA